MKKIFIYLFSFVTLLVSCETDIDLSATSIAVVDEMLVASYTSVSVECYFETRASIKHAFVQYSTSENFSDFLEAGMNKVDGKYIVQLPNLTDNTTYYIRYFLANKYSSAIPQYISQVTTLAPSVPIIRIDSIIDIMDKTALVSYILEFDGGASISDIGLCVSPNEIADTDSVFVSADSLKQVQLLLQELQPNTEYRVRAYATNKVGVGFSEPMLLTTYALPEVKTNEITNVELTSAMLNGTLIFNGNDTAVIKGFCWSDMNTPTINGQHVLIDTNEVTYEYNLSNLKDETKYYVRAYAENKIGVVYGELVYFTTKSAVPPIISIPSISEIAYTTAIVECEISSDGGAEITKRGICYSTIENPTIENSLVNSGEGNGTFSVTLSDLTDSTTYYVRAYAVNKKGISYSEQVSFMTKGYNPPSVTTMTPTNVTYTSATVGGNVTADGGTKVTERGICYSTSENPTNAGPRVNIGGGTGKFSVDLKDLREGTTYYVRAYAVNKKGVTYGNEYSFTTNAKTYIDGYEYIDLGLPSGVMWATMNVGANQSEEYGLYFAWGETEQKNTYSWSTYKWCVDNYWDLTKYCVGLWLNGSVGVIDGKTLLEPEDDAATIYWGNSWRTPTRAELIELRNNCKWNWTVNNGVSGYTVIGPNGNSIFLPAAGSYSYSQGTAGYYWSSSCGIWRPFDAWYLNFTSNNIQCEDQERPAGYCIRPVSGARILDVAEVVYNGSENLTEHSIEISAFVTSDGGTEITETGIVYSKKSNPTLDNNRIINSNDPYYYTCIIDGLNSGTTYYARIYAINSGGVAYSEEIVFKTKSSNSQNGTENGHSYVDLGLSVKWATMNIGAYSPEDYGSYFAWGEVKPKNTYNWSTYKWCNGSYDNITKYNTLVNYGMVDNLLVLEPEDDAAAVNWGGNWRMPTDAEFTELRVNCSCSWTIQNGVEGRKVVGPNGNSIFLPAARYIIDSSLEDIWEYGFYWASTLDIERPYNAHNLWFDYSSYYTSDFIYRCYGRSVRAVCP